MKRHLVTEVRIEVEDYPSDHAGILLRVSRWPVITTTIAASAMTTAALSQSGGSGAAGNEIRAISFPGITLQCITIASRTLLRVCKNITVIRMLRATALAVNKTNVEMGEKNMLMCQAAQTSPKITLASKGEYLLKRRGSRNPRHPSS
jgi:hypothetical protein